MHEGALIHVFGDKWLQVEVFESISDEGEFMLDGMSYEVFWDYDGDEHWQVVDRDIPLLLELYPELLISR